MHPVKISCQSREMLLISINVTVFCEVKKFQMQSSATCVPRSHFWWTARPSQPRTGWTRRPRVSNPSDSRLDVTHTLHSCATINRMRKNTHIPLFYTYNYNSITYICIIYIQVAKDVSSIFQTHACAPPDGGLLYVHIFLWKVGDCFQGGEMKVMGS